MNTKLFNISLIKYELRNITGNIFIIIFGILFPTFFTVVLGPIFMKSVPEIYKSHALTSFFLACSSIIPLAIVFIGYSTMFSQEIEQNIPLRFKLFGFKEKTIFFSKVIANIIVTTISFILYTVISYTVIDLEKPTASSAIILIITMLALTIIFLVIAHSLALIVKKFSITYIISMVFYFVVMILSGMMGVKIEDFPKGLQYISHLLPTTYISEDFIKFWQSGSYNFGPFIQSLIFALTIGVLLLVYANYKNRRITTS